MKHTPALIAAIILLACAPVVRVAESVVFISWSVPTDGPERRFGTCTGFAVSLASVLTAEHCLPPPNTDLYVNGKAQRVLRHANGLALVSADPGVVPLIVAKRDPKLGEQLWSWGHAFGGPIMVAGRRYSGWDGEHTVVDGPIAIGMSGGPITNEDGEVVGINQASNATFGYSTTTKEIREFIK